MAGESTREAEWAIETDDLGKRYRSRVAVAELALRVPSGQITGFLGPNGAGKSTTIALLLGLVRPSSGRIRLLGRDMPQQRAAVHPYIGALLETVGLYPYLSVAENLGLTARLGRQPLTVVADLLDRVGLTDQAHRRAGTLSLGQRQRLGLAQALIGDPALLILDEPTNGLDPAGLRAVHDLLRRFVARGGTVFFSNHRLSEVQDLCSQVVIIHRARLVAQGPVATLLGTAAGRLRLRVSEPERAQGLLAAAGWSATVQPLASGSVLHVQAPPGRAAEVNALLTAAGIGVIELQIEQLGLEEVFLQLTGATHG